MSKFYDNSSRSTDKDPKKLQTTLPPTLLEENKLKTGDKTGKEEDEKKGNTQKDTEVITFTLQLFSYSFCICFSYFPDSLILSCKHQTLFVCRFTALFFRF
jgi:hypothetical protein